MTAIPQEAIAIGTGPAANHWNLDRPDGPNLRRCAGDLCPRVKDKGAKSGWAFTEPAAVESCHAVASELVHAVAIWFFRCRGADAPGRQAGLSVSRSALAGASVGVAEVPAPHLVPALDASHRSVQIVDRTGAETLAGRLLDDGSQFSLWRYTNIELAERLRDLLKRGAVRPEFQQEASALVGRILRDAVP